MMKRWYMVTGLLVMALLAVDQAVARNFRIIDPVFVPEADLKAGSFALKPAKIKSQVDEAMVIKAVQAIANAWNSGALDPLLDDRFPSKHLLLDTIDEVVPRDATLRITGIRSIGVLGQRYDKLNKQLISTVTATVDTQIEFNDPAQGFIRLDGTNEFVLRVEE